MNVSHVWEVLGLKTAAAQKVWTALWRSGLFILVWGLLTAPLFVPMGATLTDWETSSPLRAHLYADSAGLVSLLLATWIMLRFVDRRPFRSIGFAAGGTVRLVPLGIGTGVVWLGASVLIAAIAGWISIQPPATILWAVLVAMALSIAFNVVTQQLLLCGYLFQTIESSSNVIIATLVSSLLFSLLHFGAFHGTWLPRVNVFLAGCFFCACFRLSGNLWFPVAVHFAWNVSLGTVLGLVVSGQNILGGGWHILKVSGPTLLTGGTFGLEGGLIVTSTTLMFIITILVLAYRRRCYRATGEGSGNDSSNRLQES